MKSAETVDARQRRYDGPAALALARTVDRIISIKGKSVQTLDLKDAQPDDATILAALLGPSGNLRAPAIRRGKTLVVGFDAGVYGEVL